MRKRILCFVSHLTPFTFHTQISFFNVHLVALSSSNLFANLLSLSFRAFDSVYCPFTVEKTQMVLTTIFGGSLFVFVQCQKEINTFAPLQFILIGVKSRRKVFSFTYIFCHFGFVVFDG